MKGSVKKSVKNSVKKIVKNSVGKREEDPVMLWTQLTRWLPYSANTC